MKMNNNKKYFIVSDIHSFFTALINGLDQAGFDRNNKDHVLIVCGDIFDRGFETIEVYKFLRSLPKSRCILIRGNHEDLYFDLLKKDCPDSYDYSNGTVRTFAAIAKVHENSVNPYYVSMLNEDFKENWAKVKEKVEKSAITKWLRSDRWINYYELDDNIFVHSFIPYKLKDAFAGIVSRKLPIDYFEYNPDWRKADDKSWLEATWGCPYKEFRAGLAKGEIENGKRIICGHWHASDFHESFGTKGKIDDYDIYFGENLVALDACTALTDKVNVLVISKDGYFDQYGNKLGEL